MFLMVTGLIIKNLGHLV